MQVVSFRGLVPTESLTAALRECDLLYVPMSFLPQYELLCRTSMAGKLVHYMQAQVPVLAHGPTYATNVAFVQERGIGLSTTTKDADELAGAITEYEGDFSARQGASRRCRDVYTSEFSPQAVWARLSGLLVGVDTIR
jgi:glycosyltransferase involved in cell wall biosynthesis